MTGMAKIRRAPFSGANWILKKLLRAGVPMGPMILLTVRGRTTGLPRTTPVDLFERDGRRWLAPPMAETTPTGCAISARRVKESLPAAVAGRRSLPPS
jgi:hypothetical protein